MTYNLYIDGEIGYWECSGYHVRQQVEAMKDKHIDVYISSPGGSVPDGLQIYQAFKEHGDVTVHIYGMTASAATLLAMGAKEIKMSRNALMLIHDCSVWTDVDWYMNAEEIDAAIKQLQDDKETAEKIDNIMASIYATRAGGDKANFAQKMDEAKWLTADECKELGLIDTVIEDGEAPKMTAKMQQRFVALGYPMPEGLDSNPDKKTFAQRVTEVLAALGILKPKTKPTIDMNENFALLAAAMGIEAITAKEDGSFAITAEQMAKIEDALKAVNDQLATATQQHTDDAAALAERDNTIAERDSTIAALNTQIEALQKGDGAEDKNIEADIVEANKPNMTVTAEMSNFLKDVD